MAICSVFFIPKAFDKTEYENTSCKVIKTSQKNDYSIFGKTVTYYKYLLEYHAKDIHYKEEMMDETRIVYKDDANIPCLYPILRPNRIRLSKGDENDSYVWILVVVAVGLNLFISMTSGILFLFILYCSIYKKEKFDKILSFIDRYHGRKCYFNMLSLIIK